MKAIKTKTKTTKIIFLALFFIAIFCACKSNPQNKKSAEKTGKKQKTRSTLICKLDSPMYWLLESANGTKIYILGSIHVGNDFSKQIAESALDAFFSADARFGELSLSDIQNVQTLIEQKVKESQILSDEGEAVSILKFLSEEEGKVLWDFVTENFLDEANFLGNKYLLEILENMPPWYWSWMIDTITVGMANYSAAKGVDAIFYDAALKNNIALSGLDKIEEQLDLLTLGSLDEQIEILKQKIKTLYDGSFQRELSEMDTLFEYYITDNQAGIKTMMQNTIEHYKNINSQYAKKYVQKMIVERNKSWASQIENLLKTPNKTYFIFGGAAHWLAEPSVFDFLVQNKVASWQ